MKPVLRYLRSKGLPSVLYIDDFFIPGEDDEDCLFNVNYTIKFLEWLGFLINYKKSQLVPSKICRFLGLLINSQELRIYLPEEKIVGILKNINKVLCKKHLLIQELAEPLGGS